MGVLGDCGYDRTARSMIGMQPNRIEGICGTRKEVLCQIISHTRTAGGSRF